MESDKRTLCMQCEGHGSSKREDIRRDLFEDTIQNSPRSTGRAMTCLVTMYGGPDGIQTRHRLNAINQIRDWFEKFLGLMQK